jgi:hypothetical protein
MGLLALAQEEKVLLERLRRGHLAPASVGRKVARSDRLPKSVCVRQFSIATQAVHFRKIRFGSATRVICLEWDEAFPQIVTLSGTSQTILPELAPRSEASFGAVK